MVLALGDGVVSPGKGVPDVGEVRPSPPSVGAVWAATRAASTASGVNILALLRLAVRGTWLRYHDEVTRSGKYKAR